MENSAKECKRDYHISRRTDRVKGVNVQERRLLCTSFIPTLGLKGFNVLQMPQYDLKVTF